MKLNLRINFKEFELDVNEDERLIDILRNRLNLTGTKEGCSIGVCGSCLVLIDGYAKQSCILRADKLKEGSEIITIEGVSEMDDFKDGIHPLQEKFIQYGAVQCGFCIPGMIIASLALLKKNPNPSREEIRKGIRKVLCRCTGYQKIVDAVEAYVKEK